jgi:hypothetical protein
MLASCILTACPALAGVHKELRFAKGTSSTTVQEAVIRGERDRYLIGAMKGQYLSVKVEALEDNAVIDVLYPGANDSDETDIKGIALPGAKEIKAAVVQLPVDGKYMIVVGGTRGNASYKLTVAITRENPMKTAQPAPAPVPRTSNDPIASAKSETAAGQTTRQEIQQSLGSKAMDAMAKGRAKIHKYRSSPNATCRFNAETLEGQLDLAKKSYVQAMDAERAQNTALAKIYYGHAEMYANTIEKFKNQACEG